MLLPILFLLPQFLHAAVQKERGPWNELEICGPTPENSYNGILQAKIKLTLTRGLRFAKDHQVNRGHDILHDINSGQYLVLQLLSTLVSGDEIFAKINLGLGNEMRSREIPELYDWLEANFRFEAGELYKALKKYIAWNKDPRNVQTDLMVRLADRYSLSDVIQSQNDTKTLEWLKEAKSKQNQIH